MDLFSVHVFQGLKEMGQSVLVRSGKIDILVCFGVVYCFFLFSYEIFKVTFAKKMKNSEDVFFKAQIKNIFAKKMKNSENVFFKAQIKNIFIS